MSALHRIKVKEVIKETADCVSVSFDIPQDLQSEFQYKSGQYLALETEINGEKVRRSYSLCSAPYENEWKVAIKKVEGGKFSTYANEALSDNEEMSVMAPKGGFALASDSENENHYVAFGAGSGITPILSMIKTVMHDEPKSRFTLFYGNRNFDSIIFREEIEALKNVYLDRLSVHHILSKEKLGSPLFFGRIDAQKCEKFGTVFYDPIEVAGYYLCGPAQMIFGVKDQLIAQDVDASRIHFELFNTSDILVETKKEEESFDSEAESKVTIILDGESFDMPLDYGGTSILDAALAAGADLPYACKGGVCSTCKGKVIKGEATMDINYALEPDEVENGFILTCQAHPRTSEVIVSYDET
ncbi:MAG: ring-1,2-phenylacetyl-CoA epoxidase subunit PaaE [Halioglobus sp.]|jgi:ring-1,2-phenylacetyl-CoA epoxidase subunit PaaE